MFDQQPLVSVSSLSRQHFSGSRAGGSNQQTGSSASVAAARRRFAASSVYDNSSSSVTQIEQEDDGTNSAVDYDNYTKTSARSVNVNVNDTVSSFGNRTITVATPRPTNVSSATRLRAASSSTSSSKVAKGFANATLKTNVPSQLLSSRDSTQNLYGSSSSPTRWTTNLYREFRPNTINRCVESFEKSLNTMSVEVRLHALRSLYHNACNGAAHRRAIRQRLPKLVGAVAAMCNETNATLPGGNRLHDVAFKLIACLLGDGERTSHEEAASGHPISQEDIFEGERFDNTAVLEEDLMSVAAPRALLAGGDASFAVASCLRRMSELPSIAHAIVHNDVLLESILRVLEDESVWHIEVSHGQQQQQQEQHQRSGSILQAHPSKYRSNSGNTTTTTSSSSVPNSRSNSNMNNNNNNNSPITSSSSQQQQLVMTLEGAAAVIQLRICLLNICSRPSAATYLLSRSQRFMSLMHRDAKMGVLASNDLFIQLAEQQQQEQEQEQQQQKNYSLPDTLILNAEQRHFVKSFCVGGSLLEEKPDADLANGKRLLFQPSHVVCFALTGNIFDAKSASTEALSSLPSHPSVPSEGGSAIPFSRASHGSHQPLQCKLEACRIVRGDELSLLAATSAVFALHTLHSIAIREGTTTSTTTSGGDGSTSATAELVKHLTTLITGETTTTHQQQQQQHQQQQKNQNTNSSRRNNTTGNNNRRTSLSLVASSSTSSPGNHKVDSSAIRIVLAHLKSAATSTLDVFEESDNENILRKLENFSSEGRAMLDKLRSGLYYHQTQQQKDEDEL